MNVTDVSGSGDRSSPSLTAYDMFILSQVYSIFDLVSGRVLGWIIILEGDDRPNVLQYKALTQDPSKHELYGMLMKWATAVDDIPQGLDSKEFEDWLWRREKPEQPEQPVEIDTGMTWSHVCLKKQ
jgi:hypothetical protein